MVKKLLSIPLRELAHMEIACPECHSSIVFNAEKKLVTGLQCIWCGAQDKTGLDDMSRLFKQYSDFFRDAGHHQISFLVELKEGE